MPVESREPEEYEVWLDRETAEAYADRVSRGLAARVEAKKRLLIVLGEILTAWEVARAWTPDIGIRFATPAPVRLVGVEPHFAMCPDVDQFRGQDGAR
jgi:hypothetical protein